MARHKKPAIIKELNGSAAHNPDRVNSDAPVPTRGIGPAPDYFSEDQSGVWDYLVSVMHPGVLGEPDRPTFELMAILFWRFRFGRYEEDALIPPLNNGELARLDSLMARYGMTPSDRQKIVAPSSKKKNSFDF